MSQSWHAHWAQHSFEPTRLGNWQVPNWHPKFPCERHCVATKFLADRSGRLLPDLPRSKRSPWGGFKGTWELPLKIDRKLARILSAPPKHMQAAWEAHKIRYQGPRAPNAPNTRKIVKKASPKQDDRLKSAGGKIARSDKAHARSTGNDGKKLKTRESGKLEINGVRKKRVGNANAADRDEREMGGDGDGKDRKTDGEDGGREVEESKDSPVQSVRSNEQSDRREPEQRTKSECLCTYVSDSRSNGEITPKAIRKNICTVHRRLRV